ncbi:MAG: DPP IV N-terminal domain-containing protein, partial [Acidobacteriota bacterium]
MTKRFGLILLLLLIGLLTECFAQGRDFQLEELYGPRRNRKLAGEAPATVVWMQDSRHYRLPVAQGPDLVVDARTGKSSPLFAFEPLASSLSKLSEGQLEHTEKLLESTEEMLSPSEEALLLRFEKDLFYYSLEGSLKRLTSDSAAEEFPEFSPSSEWVAYVKRNDLHVVEIQSGSIRELTSDGGENLLNGKLDWVYQEEIYGRGDFKGFWWSPDSQYIAFLQLDEAGVPRFPILNDLSIDPQVEETLYPKAGDPNPGVRLGIVAIADGEIQWADLSGY